MAGGAISQLYVEFRASTDQLHDDLSAVAKEIRDFDKDIRPVTARLDDFGQAATKAGLALTVGLTAPLVAIGAIGISFNALKEQAEIAFGTMFGSAQKAQDFLQNMQDFAATTPFEFPDLIRASQRMLAYGFSAKQILPTLTAIGDTASFVGIGSFQESIARITLAMGQIRSKGTLQAEEMRQLGEAGVPAWEILAEKLGVTIPKAMDMTKKRAISATEAIDALVLGMRERFGGGMAAQATTWNGLLSTIRDETRFIAGELTEGLFNALKGPLLAFTALLSAARRELNTWSDTTKLIIGIFGIFVASIGPALLVLGEFGFALENTIKLVGRLKLAYEALATTEFVKGAIGAAAQFLGFGTQAASDIATATKAASAASAVGGITNLGATELAIQRLNAAKKAAPTIIDTGVPNLAAAIFGATGPVGPFIQGSAISNTVAAESATGLMGMSAAAEKTAISSALAATGLLGIKSAATETIPLVFNANAGILATGEATAIAATSTGLLSSAFIALGIAAGGLTLATIAIEAAGAREAVKGLIGDTYDLVKALGSLAINMAEHEFKTRWQNFVDFLKTSYLDLKSFFKKEGGIGQGIADVFLEDVNNARSIINGLKNAANKGNLINAPFEGPTLAQQFQDFGPDSEFMRKWREEKDKLNKPFEEQVKSLVKSMTKEEDQQRAVTEAIRQGTAKGYDHMTMLRALEPQLKNIAKDHEEGGAAISAFLLPWVQEEIEREKMLKVMKAMDAEIENELKLRDMEAAASLAITADADHQRAVVTGLIFQLKERPQFGASIRFAQEMLDIQKAASETDVFLRNTNLGLFNTGPFLNQGAFVEPPIAKPSMLRLIDKGFVPTDEDFARWQKSGQTAIDSITGDMTKMFTDSIAHGKSFWDAFTNLGQDALGSLTSFILNNLIHSFLNPLSIQLGIMMESLSEHFGDLFKKIMKAITVGGGPGLGGGDLVGSLGGLVGGALGAKSGGLFGGIAGSLLGKLGGGFLSAGLGGIQAAKDVNWLAGGSGVVGIVGGAKAFVSGIGKAASALGPFGLAIAGAAVAALLLVKAFGGAHLAANEFVGATKSKGPAMTQNDFATKLSQVFDQSNLLLQQGKQTPEGLAQAREDINKLWADFIKSAQDYAKKGANQALVVQQGLATVEPIINKVMADMDQQAIDLAKDWSVANNQLKSTLFSDFTKQLKPADELNAKLADLTEAFSMSDIVSVYADQIISAYDAQIKHGFAVDGLTQQLYVQAKAYKGTTDAMAQIAKPLASMAFLANIGALTSQALALGGAAGNALLNTIASLTHTVKLPNVIPSMQHGGYVATEGLIYAHAGETVMPADSWGGGDIHIHVHVENAMDLSDPVCLRKVVVDPIERLIKTGNFGYRSRLSKYLAPRKGTTSH